MENAEFRFLAFVKGSRTPDGICAYAVVVREKKGEKWETFFSHTQAEYSYATSAEMEYRGIANAARLVRPGKALVIYTNNETAARVFSGEWRGKKHLAILDEYRRWASKRNIEVRLNTYEDVDVADGMGMAEMMCKIVIEDKRREASRV